MPTERSIALLIAERDKLNQALDALQGPLQRRGRPSKNPSAAGSSPGRSNREEREAWYVRGCAQVKAYGAAKRKISWVYTLRCVQ